MDVLVSGAFWQQPGWGWGRFGGSGGKEEGETQGESGVLHLKSFISTLSAPVAERSI